MPSPSALLARLTLASAIAILGLASGCGGGGGHGGRGGGGQDAAVAEEGAPDVAQEGEGGGAGGEQAPPELPAVGTAAGPFVASSGPTGAFIGGVNVDVRVFFSQPVDLASVDADTVQIVTIPDPSGVSSSPPGVLAQVTYAVDGTALVLRPTIDFTDTDVLYGFVQDGLYEISFSDPVNGKLLRSTTGEDLGNPEATYFFRTPGVAFDFTPGFPDAEAFLVDDATVVIEAPVVDGDLNGTLTNEALTHFANPQAVQTQSPLIELPVSPVRDMIFVFDEGIIPATALNSSDGSSPQLAVVYNSAPLPGFVPKVVPGTLFFVHQQPNLTILGWQPLVVGLPPGVLIEVIVGAGVQDLAGNSKFKVTGNGAPDLDEFLVVAGGPIGQHEPIIEPFDDTAQLDTSLSSARWGDDGLLAPVYAGGSGRLGPFRIDPAGSAADPRQTRVPIGATLDFTARAVALPTVRGTEAGIRRPFGYDFDAFDLPVGWVLSPLVDRDGDGAADPEEFQVQDGLHPLDGKGAPFVLRAAQTMVIAGTVRADGEQGVEVMPPFGPSDPAYPDYAGAGGPPTPSRAAAGAGGAGGDVLLLSGGVPAVPLDSPSAFPPFMASDGKLVGVTGRSSVVTATTLTDPNIDLSVINADGDLAAALADGEILLQPNVGVGSSAAGNAGSPNQVMDENHPTFVIESVVAGPGGSTITVRSDPGDPTLTQPSDNIGKPPVSASGDCYLVGRLRGRPGTDEAALGRQGRGAEPYVVVNEGALGITTTGGGGGGGGSFLPGLPGESDGPDSDPNVNQRGTSGGIAKDDSSGADPGPGATRGTATVQSVTMLTVDTVTAGLDLVAEVPAGGLAGHRVIVGAPTEGWIFEIADWDPGTATITIVPIEFDVVQIGLTDGDDGDGPAGPLLGIGNSVGFALLPPFDVGGAGGGGSGVSVTGTLNYSPTVLPLVNPGASGGAGAGTLVLETARNLRLTETARVSVDGGRGGNASLLFGQLAGGGGGGGGNAFLRFLGDLQLFPGALVTALGGEGGGLTGDGRGGRGGGGLIRLEDADDSVNPFDLEVFLEPDPGPENVGRALVAAGGLAHSRFYRAEFPNPEFDSVLVEYQAIAGPADGPGVPADLTWSFDDTGVGGDHARPPFTIKFNSVRATSQGLLDQLAKDDGFHAAYDLVAARAGLAYDAAAAELLFVRGRDTYRLWRLDRTTLAPVGGAQVFDPSVATSTAPMEVVSIASSPALSGELFLLERLTGRIHVLDRSTRALKRVIRQPFGLQGALTYLAPDRLVVADNVNDRLVVIPALDSAAADPANTDLTVLEPLLVVPVDRDGEFLDIEFTGLTADAAGTVLWAVDALASTLIEIDMSPGSEGTSVSSVQAHVALEDGTGASIVPSALAYDGTTLYLTRAVDPLVPEVAAIDPTGLASVSTLVVDPFDALLPEPAPSMNDGDLFLRFRVELLGEPVIDGTRFQQVRINRITISYENKPPF